MHVLCFLMNIPRTRNHQYKHWKWDHDRFAGVLNGSKGGYERCALAPSIKTSWHLDFIINTGASANTV